MFSGKDITGFGNLALVLSLSVLLLSCSPFDLNGELSEAITEAKLASNPIPAKIGKNGEILVPGKRGDWRAVLSIVDRCLFEAPNCVDAKALKALALSNLIGQEGVDMEDAIELARQASTLEPDRYDLKFIYGWVLLQAGRTNDAIDPLKKAYGMHCIPNGNSKAVTQVSAGAIKYALGECYFRNNVYDEALKYFNEAIKHTPYMGWQSLHNNIAYIYFLRQDFGNMARIFERKDIFNNKDSYAFCINKGVLWDYLSFPKYNPNITNEGQILCLRKAIMNYRLGLEGIRVASASSPNNEMTAFYTSLYSMVYARYKALGGK